MWGQRRGGVTRQIMRGGVAVSKPAFQWQGTSEQIHRQWQQGTKQTQDRHGGHQFTYGSSVTSLVTGGTVLFSEQPRETITQQRENLLLRVSLNIWIYPSESFSGFQNRGPEQVTPSMWNTKVFRLDHYPTLGCVPFCYSMLQKYSFQKFCPRTRW